MNTKIITLVFLVLSLMANATEIKTQEQSIEETVARSAGSMIRFGKQPKSDCDQQYQGSKAQACKEGYDATDKMLNKPVSK